MPALKQKISMRVISDLQCLLNGGNWWELGLQTGKRGNALLCRDIEQGIVFILGK